MITLAALAGLAVGAFLGFGHGYLVGAKEFNAAGKRVDALGRVMRKK